MASKTLRWGILSTADIARKNWQAILHSGNGVVSAVASRDLDRSRQFTAECQRHAPFPTPPRPLEGYQALIESPDVDALYIPLPTGLRKPWVLRAAAAGKHVICEKPCAASTEDLRQMIDACHQTRVQFMDGVMFMHSRRLARVREILDDSQSVGRIKRMTSMFTFCAPDEFLAGNIRVHSDLEPYGCLGDLGWYSIRFFLWALRWEMPHQVIGRCLSEASPRGSSGAVPTEFSGELLFGNGASASFFCSFLAENLQFVNLSGTRGYLQLQDFVLPFSGNQVGFDVNTAVFGKRGCDFTMEDRTRRVTIPEHSNSHPDAQETNMFRHFADQVLSGRLNEEWPEMALRTQHVVEACVGSARQGGVPVTCQGWRGVANR